jgi:Fe-S-cluster containining protein
MPGECSGKCCAVFNYPTTPDKLRLRSEGREGFWPDQDRFLADMLVSLTPDEAEERALRFEITPPSGFNLASWAEQGLLYTCRHWDEESRLCTVYEDRPQMCREYPYAGRCQHDCDCTFTCETHIRTKWAASNVAYAVRTAT